MDAGASESPRESVVLEASGRANGDADMASAEAVEPKAGPRRRQQQKPVAQLFTPPAGEPDDLKKITGIGPTLERKLNAMGITQYDQLANLSEEDVAKVDEALTLKGRFARDDWTGQAKRLATGEPVEST
jgi:predicted flap endonuclease-1-like 5' DNA nuclease